MNVEFAKERERICIHRNAMEKAYVSLRPVALQEGMVTYSRQAGMPSVHIETDENCPYNVADKQIFKHLYVCQFLTFTL